MKKKWITIGLLFIVFILASYITFYAYTINTKVTKLKFLESITLYENEPLKPETFLQSNKVKSTNLTFKEEVNTSKEGKYEDYVVVTGFLVIKKEFKISYEVKVKDIDSPVIAGLSDKIIYVGETIDFNEGVTVTDNINPSPTLEIDKNSVDFNNVGTYTVTYKASDGENETTETINVKVRMRPNKVVYLTFDDGPSWLTPKILEVLKENNVKATFFVTGQYITNYYKTIMDAGHTVALHTFSHKYSIYTSVESYFADLNKLEEAIKTNTGSYPQKVLRFPGGSSNTVSAMYSKGIMTTLVKEVKNRGYRYFDWNCDVGDGDILVTVEKEISNVKNCIGSNVINLLAHDTKTETYEAMKVIIPMLLDYGYSFEVIDMYTDEIHHPVNN